MIQLLARLNRRLFADSLPAIYREIQAAGLPRFWLPEEYLGKLQLIAVCLTPVYVYLFFGWFGAVGWCWRSWLVVLTAWLLRRRLAGRAQSAAPPDQAPHARSCWIC